MIDFELEFQYEEARAPALERAAGHIPAGRCVVLVAGVIVAYRRGHRRIVKKHLIA